MAAIQCPQCGREIPEPAPDFCPNPDCGYPLSFAKPEPDDPEPAMERRPLEKVEPTVVSPPPPVIKETPPPVTPPPVTPTPPPVPPKPPRSGPNPGLLIAAAVAVVVVIALVVAFAGGGGGDAEEAGAEPPAASQDGRGGATDEPEPEPEPEVISYARVPHDEAVLGGEGDQMIHRVIAGDGELIAVGRSGFEGSFDAALWTSGDGSAWRRIDADPAVVGGEGEQEMTAIARHPDGYYVIVGYDRTSVDENAAVWTYDGAVVERVDVGQAALGGDGMQEMTRVVAAHGRLVAVGTDGLNDPHAPDAGVWESVDGASWARVTSEHLGGDHHQFMRTITAFGDGFVGAGDELSDSGFDAAVWWSDGASVDRVFGTGETFGGDGDQQIFSVLTYDGGVMAVGSAAGGEGVDATVWTSEDGLSWQRISDPAALGGPARQTMFGAIAAGDLIVAVGFDGAAGEGDDAAIWQSPDGRTWSRSTVDAFGGPGEQRMKGVAVLEGTVVAVGWDGSEGDLDAAVWTGQIP